MAVPPVLRVYRSNRTEVLAEALSDLLATPGGGPFDPECLVVQSRGMATWLSQELARRQGVWANAQYLFPRNFVERAYRDVLGAGEADREFSRERLFWAVLGALPECLGRPAFARLRTYLGEDEQGLRRFQLARRIAGVFDQYLTYRPEWIAGWEAGGDGGAPARRGKWQPELWRALVGRLGSSHVASREEEFRAALAAPAGSLPARVSVFGIASLPALYLRVLGALAQCTEVHVFALAPSQPRRDDPAFEAPDLLESLGELGAEFELALDQACSAVGVALDVSDHFHPEAPRCTLGRLQQRLLVPPSAKPRPAPKRSGGAQHPVLPFAEAAAPEPEAPWSADGSISVHSCHGPMREVEVLHDHLLDWLAQDTGIEPRDVVVMMPDVEVYAPLIEAVFDRVDDECRIPYRIADRSLRSESPVVEAIQRVLALVGGRSPASEVLDLLRLAPVYERFGFTAADLDQITSWVVESGIRWGIDAEDRARNGQPATEENTWRFGLHRMLLGYALPTEGRETFADMLPFEEIEGHAARLLGLLAEFCERLFTQLGELAEPRPVAEWRDAIGALMDTMLAPDPQGTWQHERVRRALGEMADHAEEMGFDEAIELPVLRLLLDPQIDGGSPERGFLAGGVTFCAFVPMRSIPFKVVCMLGMSDGAFPRAERSVDFDLLAVSPRQPGDRQRRSDDRYLFLEALVSARERVWISYVGQSIRDNSDRPPSVVVTELAESLAGVGVDSEELVVRHPLQGFSQRYFEESPDRDARLFSYSESYCAGADSLGGTKAEVPALFTEPLPADAEADWSAVTLDELLRFVRNPVAHLLNRRLQIHLRDTELDIPDREPLELDPLQRYQVGDRLLALGLAGVEREDSLRLLRAHGLLPPGATGEVAHTAVWRTAETIAREARQARASGPLEPVPFRLDLPGGTRLLGVLTDRTADGIVTFQFSRVRAKHLLAAWVRHLAYCAAAPEGAPSESVLIGRAMKRVQRGKAKIKAEVTLAYHFRPVAEPLPLLERWIELMRVGHDAPLVLPPDTALAYGTSMHRYGDEPKALSIATTAWDGWGSGERKFDIHLRRTFGDLVPPFEGAVSVGPAFGELAREVLYPMFEHMREQDL